MGVLANHIEDIIFFYPIRCKNKMSYATFPALLMVTCFSRAGCAHQRLRFPTLKHLVVCVTSISDWFILIMFSESEHKLLEEKKKWRKPNGENLLIPKRKFAGWSRTGFVRWLCLCTAVQTNSVWNFQNQICPGFQFCNHYLCKAK